MNTYGKHVHSLSDIPAGHHWAILSISSVFIPGDERSRTAPGHGYPEHTESYVDYECFTNEIEFRNALEERLGNKYHYANGFQVIGIEISKVFRGKVAINVIEQDKKFNPGSEQDG